MQQQVRHFLEAGVRSQIFYGVPGDGESTRLAIDMAESGRCGDDAFQVLRHATGFGFPFVAFLPSHAVGIISLVVLAAVIVARYVKHLTGAWRGIYVWGAVLALYLNVFVLLVQLFRRLPALIVAAPKQQEPPFLVTPVVVLALFVWVGRAGVQGFRGGAGGMAWRSRRGPWRGVFL